MNNASPATFDFDWIDRVERGSLASAWAWRRSASAKRAFLAHGVASFLVAATAFAAIAMGWRPTPDEARVVYLLVAVHLCALLPLQTAASAAGLLRRVHGDGEEEGHHLHLLAIPDQPAPLYFHLVRACVARVASLAEVATRAACFLYGAAAALVAAPPARPAYGGGSSVADMIGHATIGGLIGFMIAAIAVGFLARLATVQAVALFSDLGAASSLAVDGVANPRLHVGAEEATRWDEEWGRHRSSGWFRWLGAAFRWALLLGLGTLALVLLANADAVAKVIGAVAAFALLLVVSPFGLAVALFSLMGVIRPTPDPRSSLDPGGRPRRRP